MGLFIKRPLNFESSERRRDVFEQGVCSKAEEIDSSLDETLIDDHSCVRDGVIREVDVGTGLSGALNLLREQGTFKEKSSKLVGVRDNHEDDRFKYAFNEIRIESVDECGRILTAKEAFSEMFSRIPWEIKIMHPTSIRALLETVPPSSTKTQLCSENLRDKFSELPESILSIILSHLTTVEAVRTSVLSMAWRTNVTELQFDDLILEQRDNGFIEFVDRVIRDIGSPNINTFYLHFVNSYDEAPLISWLSKVLECNLQKLVIFWFELETVNVSPLLASFGSLVELRLRTQSILDISAPALFPKLKFFSLEDARIFNMSSSVSVNLFLNFRVLETFETSRCCWFRTDTVVIDSPFLRVFHMFKCSCEHVPNNSGKCTIRILASKLEKITFSGNGTQKILLSFPPSLPEAHLALSGPKSPGTPQWPKRFLHRFTCVTSLSLEIRRDFQLIKVPKFRHLVALHLTYDMTNIDVFSHFLKSAPILEMLNIRDLTSPRFSPNLKSMRELRYKTAPKCVRRMLKVLKIRDFKVQEPQLSVLRHVIANAEIFESVILSTAQPITEKGKELVLSYPRASPHGSVIFE